MDAITKGLNYGYVSSGQEERFEKIEQKKVQFKCDENPETNECKDLNKQEIELFNKIIPRNDNDNEIKRHRLNFDA